MQKIQSLMKAVTLLPFRWFSSLVMPGDDSGIKNLFWIFIFAIFVVVAVFAVDLYISLSPRKIEFEHGAFGDFFGGVANPILTFFAFVGLLITITIQRVELKESRLELAKSARALEEQSESVRLQNSVANFYKLIDNHQSSLGAIDLISNENKVSKGRDCLRVFRDRLKSIFEKNVRPNDAFIISRSIVDMRRDRQDPKAAHIAFQIFWSQDGEELQSYMAVVGLTLSYIDTVLNGAELYVRMYGSLFSDSEKVLIFYYALVYGDEGFKSLLSKYKFCSGVPQAKLLDSTHVLGLESIDI